eukprot:4923404-Prorocentrum_lima.AAC.1
MPTLKGMQPDTDTESDEEHYDEEYQTLLSAAGRDPRALAETAERLCEAYFQAKRRWRNCIER